MNKNVELLDLYKANETFKTYVDKYAKHHNKLFPEDCFYDVLVINYANYLKEKENKKNG